MEAYGSFKKEEEEEAVNYPHAYDGMFSRCLFLVRETENSIS